MKKAFLVFLSAVLISISQYTQNNFVFAYSPEIVGDGIDNDGDGYVDEIENYVITNPNVGVPMPDNSNVGVPLFNVGVPMPDNSNVGVPLFNVGVPMPDNSNVGVPLFNVGVPMPDNSNVGVPLFNVGVPMPGNSNVGVPLFNVGVPMPDNSNVGVQVPYSNYGNIGVQMPNNSNVGIPLTGQTPVNKPVLRSPNQPSKNPPKQNASGQSSNSINLLGNAAQGYKDGSTGYCARHGQPLFNNATKCFYCK